MGGEVITADTGLLTVIGRLSAENIGLEQQVAALTEQIQQLEQQLAEQTPTTGAKEKKES
jgi:hypothetical protein